MSRCEVHLRKQRWLRAGVKLCTEYGCDGRTPQSLCDQHYWQNKLDGATITDAVKERDRTKAKELLKQDDEKEDMKPQQAITAQQQGFGVIRMDEGQKQMK